MFDDPRRDAPEKIIITNVSHDRAASHMVDLSQPIVEETGPSSCASRSIGETVTFMLEEHAVPATNLIECPVTEIRGDFVKCGPRTHAAGRDRLERWVALKYVVQITKNES